MDLLHAQVPKHILVILKHFQKFSADWSWFMDLGFLHIELHVSSQ